MNLLMVNGTFLPGYFHGGTAHTTYGLAKSLQNMGENVRVITTDKTSPSGVRPKILNELTQFDGLGVYYCKLTKGFIPYYSKYTKRVIRYELPNTDAVLINTAFTCYGVTASIECRKNKIPYFIYAHGSYEPDALKMSRTKKLLWWELIDKQIYNNAAGIVCLTENEKNTFEKLCPKKEKWVIPNGVGDIENDLHSDIVTNYLRQNGISEPYILYLGRVTEKKGLDLYYRAYAECIKEGEKRVPIVIVGPKDDQYAMKLDELAADLGIARDLHYFGPADKHEKAALFAKAKYYILPSKSEGLPMAILEALQLGVPVMITDACNLGELKDRDIGVTVHPTVEEIKKGIVKMSRSEHLYGEWVKKGKELVKEKYTWDGVAIATINMIKTVVD